jgi:DNA-binding beta-propeller fold protein YncE
MAMACFFYGSPGCATRALRPGFWERTQLDRVWPAPPEQARIGYLGEIRSAEELGQAKGWLQTLGDRIFGEAPMSWLKEDLAAVLGVPVGIALDDQGNAYVSDSARRKVFVFDAERRLVRTLGEGTLKRPTGIALDPSQQRVYVVDTIACQVLTFDLNGRLVSRFGSRGAGPGQMNAPTYIAVAPDGTLAISDTLNFRVHSFSPDGTLLNSFGRVGDSAGAFARPKGIAYDHRGRLYIADGGFDNVQIFDPEGRLLLTFGAPGRDAGEFNLPVGLMLDSTQAIWVADSYNRRVQAFRLLGD